MKIGFVRRGFSPSGGAESYLNRLARGITNAGHDVELFTDDEWPARSVAVRTDATIARQLTDRFC